MRSPLDGPRGATPRELAEVVRGANEVFRPRGGEGDMGSEYPLLFNRANAENLRIFRDRASGRVVAHVGLCFQDIVLRGARIPVVEVGAVYTLPSYRGLGLATKLMEDAFVHSRRRGAALMLVSGGRGLYRRLGCVTAAEFWKYRLAKTTAAKREKVKIRRARERDLPLLVALYRREPVRFVRPLRDARKLWKADRMMNSKCWFWIVEENREALGYLAHTGVWQAKEKDGKRVLPILELAGDRRALSAALPLLFERFDTDELAVFALGCDAELADALRDYPREQTEFWGTVRILDAARFLRCLGNGLQLRWRAGEEWVEFLCGGQRLRFEGAEVVTRALFGRGETWKNPLCKEWRRHLPLPLVWYGWNYI